MLSLFRKKNIHGVHKSTTVRRLSPLQFQVVVGVMLAIFIGIFTTVVWYGTRITSLQINEINVLGGITIPHATIVEKVDVTLTGSYMKLIPKRFMPLYPKTAILEAVGSFERVKNVYVERTENQSITIVFEEYLPYALLCAAADDDVCFFIDSTGYAFTQAPSLQGSALVRYVEDGVRVALGVTAFDDEYIKNTTLYTNLLKEKLSMYVTHIKKIDTYDVEYTIAGGGLIKVSQSIPVEDTFNNLETILNSKEFEHIEPGAFQYIDLRFGDKVFVNEALPATGSSTSTATST